MNAFRRMKFGVLRLMTRSVGMWSDGVRMAFEDGFTSGTMLDYIYRNQPSGRNAIGRLIDHLYLSHRGWETVRKRKDNLERLLARAIELQRGLDRQPVLLDVASGPARYMLNVLSADPDGDLTAICRDLADDAIRQGQSNAAEMGLENIRFERGDALSAPSLAEVNPVPNVIVSSGFYDWISDDELVKKSMQLICDLLPRKGCFVFTNQSGHVDLEMVNAIFIDFNKEPLQMVTRPIEAVNEWAETIGFKVINSASDAFGDYTVTLAQKE